MSGLRTTATHVRPPDGSRVGNRVSAASVSGVRVAECSGFSQLRRRKPRRVPAALSKGARGSRAHLEVRVFFVELLGCSRAIEADKFQLRQAGPRHGGDKNSGLRVEFGLEFRVLEAKD